ncbi:MAG: redoxin domain-containing protein [Chitinophagaceae bacterium]|nr:redoxin domain-containing protein [Chitinophagaceae bacterium]
MKCLSGNFLTVSLLLFSITSFCQGYQVTLQTPDYTGGLAYLTYYYGKNANIQDSALVDKKGVAVFKSDKKLAPGVYSIVLPGKTKLADFLVDKEQIITVKIDTTDLVNKTIVSGSKENELFQQYQKFTSMKGKQLDAEQRAYKISRTQGDSLLHEKKYNLLSVELTQYRENIIKIHPQSMLASLLQSMAQTELPKARPVTKKDSLINYEYYRKHYWDGVSFMDDRIIRTPFFLPKLETYFREVLPPVPDSIIKESDYILLLARSNPEMYKFLLNWLTDEYIYPKYMGQDAVFVHLYEKYHSKGVSVWLNEKQQNTISNRAYMLMANQIGEKASDLEMIDTSGRPYNLYDVNADYTVVCFWDPTCSHCRAEVPELDTLYQTKWKQEGVKMYGVLTENEKDKWLQFIKKYNLAGWIHVYQTEEMKKAGRDLNKPGYHQLYDVTETPTLYLLDKEKRIIAKKLSWKQLDDVLQAKLKIH